MHSGSITHRQDQRNIRFFEYENNHKVTAKNVTGHSLKIKKE